MAALRGVRVAIVGAGLSGLVAARTLARRGAAVHVFEARERVGGRVLTLRDGAIAPHAVEAGGEFIDGEHKTLRALTRELDLPLVRVLREGFGLALQTSAGLRVHATQAAIWGRFKRALKPTATLLESVACDWHTSVAAAIARMSLDELLARRNASLEVRAMAQALRGFFLADADRLSALVGTELSREDSDPGHVPLYRIRGGNDRLPLALMHGADVKLSGRHAVKAIEQTVGHVRLAVEDSKGLLDHVHCDYVILTVPASLATTLHFDPPLPEDQRRALDTLSYGPATKAILRFPSRWWRRRGRPRAYGTNLPVGAIWESAEEQRNAAFLTFLAGGSASRSLGELLERHGPGGVLERIAWLGRPAAVEAVAHIDWERDPWARGGYAYFAPSFPPHLRSALARAFGRVLFAGDHTSREYQGYMNGAVESGFRVADELAALHSIH